MVTSHLPSYRRVAGAVSASALALLLGTACGASLQSTEEDAGSQGASAQAPGAEDRAATEERAGEESSTGEGGGSHVGSDVEVGDRQLVHTADLTVRVENVPEAVEEAKRLTLGAEGYIASESVSTPDGGTPEGSLSLRIPSDGYEEALEGLSDLGDRSGLERSVQDVTEEVADVESRVESSETALETLRGYLEEARDVDELLRVEEEIQSRQSELEAFQARLEALRDQTAYSTVDLTLLPPETYLEEPTDDSVGFLGALERGWRALLALGQGVTVVVGWLLPFLVTAAVLGAGPLWWYRSRRERRSGHGPGSGRSRASAAGSRRAGDETAPADGASEEGTPGDDAPRDAERPGHGPGEERPEDGGR